MEDKEREHGKRNGTALIISVALIVACSTSSSVIDPDETTGAISLVSQPMSIKPLLPKIECPRLDVHTPVKRDQAADNLSYELSFGQTTRECRPQGDTMFIKIGVQGHILFEPFRTTRSFDIPLHYAVVREGPKPKLIATKFKRIRATIAAGKTHAQFVDIEGGLSFSLPSSADLAAYVIYVGFEKMGDEGEKKLASTAKESALPLSTANQRGVDRSRGGTGSSQR
jgi:hypothetical protein